MSYVVEETQPIDVFDPFEVDEKSCLPVVEARLDIHDQLKGGEIPSPQEFIAQYREVSE